MIGRGELTARETSVASDIADSVDRSSRHDDRDRRDRDRERKYE